MSRRSALFTERSRGEKKPTVIIFNFSLYLTNYLSSHLDPLIPFQSNILYKGSTTS